MIVGFVLVSSIAVAQVSAASAALRSAHLGDPAELDVVVGSDDRPLSVIGRFAGSGNAERSVRAFVDAHASFFGVSGPIRDGQLVLTGEDVVDENLSVAYFDQVVGGLRIWDAEVTASFWNNGDIHSINGILYAAEYRAATPPAASLDEVLAIVTHDLGISVEAASFAPQAVDGMTRFVRDDGFWAERGYNIRREAVEWRAWMPEGDVRIDETLGVVVDMFSHEDYGYDGVTTACNVRRPNYPRDVNGLATSLNTQSGTQVSGLTCGGDDWFGTCYWHLKRQPAGLSHPIARVDDANGSEQEIVQACTSGATPSFTDTGGDYMREQTAFWSSHAMRGFILQNVWANITPNRTANVDSHHDDEIFGGPCGAWSDIFTAIYMPTACSGQGDQWMHEYGHYVVWSYDDVSNECIAGSNEGNPLDETLANCFAMVTATDDSSISPDYGALASLANQGPAPHTTAGTIQILQVNCAVDEHFIGRPFEQAVWEILFNRNCSNGTCSSTSGFGNQLWVGESQEAVIDHVGTALGSALKVLGPNITFAQVRAQFVSRVRTDSGNTIGDRVLAVFSHHSI